MNLRAIGSQRQSVSASGGAVPVNDLKRRVAQALGSRLLAMGDGRDGLLTLGYGLSAESPVTLRFARPFGTHGEEHGSHSNQKY